jgi:hypothetical protein
VSIKLVGDVTVATITLFRSTQYFATATLSVELPQERDTVVEETVVVERLGGAVGAWLSCATPASRVRTCTALLGLESPEAFDARTR